MRTVAQYAFTSHTSDPANGNALFLESCRMVETWLTSKGIANPNDGKIHLHDGRIADFESVRQTCSLGAFSSWTLSEPSGATRFSTMLALANAGAEVAFTCNLSTGSTATVIAPQPFTARCPYVVKDILKLKPGWCIGDTPVECEPLRFSGSEDAKALVTRILSPRRTLPIVVASRYDGFPLHPNIVDVLASDICGLGIVADLNDDAAWEMTALMGKEWSCYNGAIRIYWPHLDTRQNPRNHPLWTSERLMYLVTGTEDAARRIRNVIRKRLFSVSAFGVERPSLFEKLEDESAREASQEKLALATTAGEYKEFAELYAKENESLRLQLRQERDNIKQLRQDLYQLQLVKAWESTDEEVAPDEETPPISLQDAVDKARRLYAQQLTFGNDVADGIQTVARNAGPPQKVLDYLKVLAELVDRRREGNLGDTMIQWLKQHGVLASSESDTVQNNPAEMRKRTWDDGRRRRAFELHLKPSEATSPDRCVRIYFHWDDPSAKAIIGWVGRHPDT
jgi:hypothetical protein